MGSSVNRNRVHKNNDSNTKSSFCAPSLSFSPMSFSLHHQTHDFQEDRYCKGWIPNSEWNRSKATEVLVIFIFPFLAPVHNFWRQVHAALHLGEGYLGTAPRSSKGKKNHLSQVPAWLYFYTYAFHAIRGRALN